MLKETASRMRVRRKKGKKFWTARGLRQGCALNSYLFNILITDKERRNEKKKMGRSKVGEEKVYSGLRGMIQYC